MMPMGVLENKIAAAAGNRGERRFRAEPGFVPLCAAAWVAFSDGVQPADGESH
jgi:hypothetical protein